MSGRALGSGGRALASGVAAAGAASLVLIATVTGAGPWDFTGLAGDAAGLVRYELVVNAKNAAAVAFDLGIQLNGDETANYWKVGVAVADTSLLLASNGADDVDGFAQGLVIIPRPASGSPRAIDPSGILVGDASSVYDIGTGKGAWFNTPDAISSARVLVRSGAVDSDSTMSLFKLVTS